MSLALDPEDVRLGRVCPYCGGKPQLVDSAVVYGRSYGLMWRCEPCDAYVGVHRGSTTPLGRLADAENRRWKKAAHAAFDRLWKGEGAVMTRSDAYAWLSAVLGTPLQHTHIGMFDWRTCQRVCDEVDLRRNMGAL